MNPWKQIIKTTLNITAAIASVISGAFWYLSTITPTHPEKLNNLAQHSNVWAAFFAVVAGVAFFLNLFFMD